MERGFPEVGRRLAQAGDVSMRRIPEPYTRSVKVAPPLSMPRSYDGLRRIVNCLRSDTSAREVAGRGWRVRLRGPLTRSLDSEPLAPRTLYDPLSSGFPGLDQTVEVNLVEEQLPQFHAVRERHSDAF